MKVSASIYSTAEFDLEKMAYDPSLNQVDMWHVDSHNDFSVFEDIVELRKFDKRPIDLHIITQEPETFIPFIARYEVEQVCFQFENITSGYRFEPLQHSKLGIAILPETRLEEIKDLVKNCDFILFMATVPGVSGQPFNTTIIDRVVEGKKLFPEKEIVMDGGINGETVKLIRHLKPDSVVSGSYVFKHDDRQLAIQTLKRKHD